MTQWDDRQKFYNEVKQLFNNNSVMKILSQNRLSKRWSAPKKLGT